MHMSERRDVHGTHFRNPLPGTNICLDVTDRDSVQTFVESYRPDVLIWLSGSKDVSRCELEPNHAFSVNTAPIEVLGSIAKHVNPHMHIILFSTDYVFDGVRGQYRDTDRCYPTTQYGKSKLQAEIILRNCGVPYTIIRTSAVMARGGGDFLNGWRSVLRLAN